MGVVSLDAPYDLGKPYRRLSDCCPVIQAGIPTCECQTARKEQSTNSALISINQEPL